jgi:hypothetical protein
MTGKGSGMTNERIDVLAVMEAAYYGVPDHRGDLAEEIHQASMAVTKLIETVRRVAEYEGTAGLEAAVLADNRVLLRNALARVQGEGQ